MIAIESLTEAGLPTALAIERAAQPTPWSEGNLRDAMQAGYLCLLASHPEHPICGLAVVMRGVFEGEVLTLSVLPAARRLGVARSLIQHAIAALPSSKKLHLEVRASNIGAMAFYQRLGFEPTGRRPGYYPASTNCPVREDAVLMCLNLAARRDPTIC